MKGYLQRLAATAAGAPRRLHPLVDSLFARSRRDEAAGPRAPAEIQSDGITATGPTEGPSGLAKTRMAEPNGDTTLEVPIQRPIEAESPARRESREETGTARRDAPATRLMAGSESPEGIPSLTPPLKSMASAKASARTPASATAVQPSLTLVGQGMSYQPLVAHEKPAPVTGTILAAAATADLRVPVTLAPRHPGRRATGANGGIPRPAPARTDDIQIHIGRIEVTAVPPAAPRPVPTPPRKTQTLDEYLRTSKGRVG